jgi:hypothetical protein
MRRAFVMQLGPETRPTQHQFDGWIEEVDPGRELRFRSMTSCWPLSANSLTGTIASLQRGDENSS